MPDPTILGNRTLSDIDNAIAEQSLPLGFKQTVNDYYWPLTQSLVTKIQTTEQSNVTFIGIQGSQGSGKSTCAAFLKLLLEAEFGLRTLVISIDDFYLTQAERKNKASTHHPLFLTRGVPGTHDVAMMMQVFDQAAKQQVPFAVPVFDKATDDRASQEHWQIIKEPVDVVILEGWCVGITPQKPEELGSAINQLEKNEDKYQTWRNEVNLSLSNEYHKLFKRLDILIALQAPSFSSVLGWRQLQEEKMIAKLQSQGKSIAKAQTPEQIERFISHYQRLTEHALQSMPKRANYLLWLDKSHQFNKLELVTT